MTRRGSADAVGQIFAEKLFFSETHGTPRSGLAGASGGVQTDGMEQKTSGKARQEVRGERKWTTKTPAATGSDGVDLLPLNQRRRHSGGLHNLLPRHQKVLLVVSEMFENLLASHRTTERRRRAGWTDSSPGDAALIPAGRLQGRSPGDTKRTGDVFISQSVFSPSVSQLPLSERVTDPG